MDPMTVLVEQRLPPQRRPARPGHAATSRGSARCTPTRDDLRGVYAFADVVEEAVRWSA